MFRACGPRPETWRQSPAPVTKPCRNCDGLDSTNFLESHGGHGHPLSSPLNHLPQHHCPTGTHVLLDISGWGSLCCQDSFSPTERRFYLVWAVWKHNQTFHLSLRECVLALENLSGLGTGKSLPLLSVLERYLQHSKAFLRCLFVKNILASNEKVY